MSCIRLIDPAAETCYEFNNQNTSVLGGVVMKRCCTALLAFSLSANAITEQSPNYPQSSTTNTQATTTSTQSTTTRNSQTNSTAPPPSSRNGTGDVPQNPHNHTKPDPPIVQPRTGGNNELGDSLLAAGGGLVAGMLIGRLMHSKNDPVKTLSDHGPQCADLYSMSAITVLGFVKGNWPMVLDYELREPGIYMVTVSIEGMAPFEYLLDGSKVGHQQQIFVLPARLGPQAQPATCTLRALSSSPGEARPLYLRVFGWGCGNRAVGSVAIDQVRFTPPSVRPRDKQAVLFGFHSHADFEKVSAEFERVALVNGSIVAKVEDREKIDEPVRVNTEISDKRWDAKKASVGQHLLQIRAWYTLNHGGDWVIAWSPEIVRIEE